MEADKIAVMGFFLSQEVLSQVPKEKINAYISDKANMHGRILFTISDYLTKYSRKFDRVRYLIADEMIDIFPNGTLSGIIGMVNRSEIDIGVQPVAMHERTTEMMDFCYPYKLYTSSFVTPKPKYKPQIFGIFETFSLPLWISIISTLIAMSLVYYVTLKRRYSFDKILLHTFAVLLRQSSIFKPSSMIENLLVFSWVLGAMFLCLAYDSVFLSFLAFPPITPIKNVPQLAKAVKEGRYHCIATQESPILELLLSSTHENLRIIGQDIKTNNLSNIIIFQDFILDRSKQNLAFLVDAEVIAILSMGEKIVSEDRFLESMGAMTVRKDFCGKKLMEKFVHRFMASGLFFKYQNDKSFFIRLPRLLEYVEKDTSKRKLTLTDVAPAFIFLIFGHIISVLVLIAEILSSRLKKNKNRAARIACKKDSLELSLKMEA